MKPHVVGFMCKVTQYSSNGRHPLSATFDVALSDGKHDHFVRTGTEQIKKTREVLTKLVLRKR